MPNIKNLKQARRLIESVNEDRLHMNTIAEKASCGTAYCLIGWMTVDPWFRAKTKMGLIRVFDDGLLCYNDTPVISTSQAVLGIDAEDAELLFALNVPAGLAPHAISKQEVIDNLDRLIAGSPAKIYAAILEL